MSVKVIPFEAKHVDLMDVRDHEYSSIFQMGDFREKLFFLESLATGGTIVYDDVYLGAMGYMQYWPGMCEVWVIPTKQIPKYAMVFAKKVKQNLEMLMNIPVGKGGFHRVQITALDDDTHNRWCRWLGFSCEGTMKRYSVDQRDYNLWARVQS